MLALLLLLAAAAPPPPVYAQPLATSEPALAGPSVVVLWATWCVSCKAELARLPALAAAAAAAPLPIATLAVDRSDTARAALVSRGMPLDRAYADGRPPRTVLDAWGGPGSALPIAVAIDRDGRICGRKVGLLGTDQLNQWAARCSR